MLYSSVCLNWGGAYIRNYMVIIFIVHCTIHACFFNCVLHLNAVAPLTQNGKFLTFISLSLFVST